MWFSVARAGGCRSALTPARDPTRRRESAVGTEGRAHGWSGPGAAARRGLRACEVSPRTGCAVQSSRRRGAANPPIGPQPPQPPSAGSSTARRVRRPSAGPLRPPGVVGHAPPAVARPCAASRPLLVSLPARGRRRRPGRACGRCSPSPRWSPASTRPIDPGAPATAASTCSAPGQPVRAALAGHGHLRRRLAGRGVVVVDHGDTRTTYEPVDRVGRRRRRRSPPGAVIGTLGARRLALPPAGLPALGLARGETYLDPLRLVGAGPVRLLPLWRRLRAGRGQSRTSAGRPRRLHAVRPRSRLVLRPGGAPAGRPGAAGRW